MPMISETIITLKYEIGFMASLLTENQSGHDSDNIYNTKQKMSDDATDSWVGIAMFLL